MSDSTTTTSLRTKTVAVLTRTRTGYPAVLRDCFLETRGNRLFLVGTSITAQKGQPEWTDGVRRAIAWDAIDEYFLFDSPDDYYAHAKKLTVINQSGADPLVEYPSSEEGNPVEPSGVAIDPETPLDVGTRVLSFSMGRWWRAEVIAVEDDEHVRIHYPGWDDKWDVSVTKTELQVDLSASIDAE